MKKIFIGLVLLIPTLFVFILVVLCVVSYMYDYNSVFSDVGKSLLISSSRIAIYDANGVLIDNTSTASDLSNSIAEVTIDTPKVTRFSGIESFFVYMFNKYFNIHLDTFDCELHMYKDNSLKNYLATYIAHTKMTDTESKTIHLKYTTYGSGIVGIECASQRYFGVKAEDLTDIQLEFIMSLYGNDHIVTSTYVEDFLKKHHIVELTSPFIDDTPKSFSQMILNEVCSCLGVTYDELDKYLAGKNMSIKTSISVEVNSILATNTEATCVVIDNATGMIRGMSVSCIDNGVGITTLMKADNIINNIAYRLPLYNTRGNLPEKLTSIDPIATIQSMEKFDESLRETAINIMAVVNNGLIDATTLVDSCAMYSMLTRNGLYVEPSCVVAIRVGDRTIYSRKDAKVTRIYGKRASSLLLDSLGVVVSSDALTLFICDKFTLSQTNSNSDVYDRLLLLTSGAGIITDYDVGKEREEVIGYNIIMFKEVFENKLSVLSNMDIMSKDSADTFRELYSSTEQLVDHVMPVITRSVADACYDKLYSLRRERNSELVKYVA